MRKGREPVPSAEELDYCMAAAARDHDCMIKSLQTVLTAFESRSSLDPEADLQFTYEMHAVLKRAVATSARRLRFYDRSRNYGGRGPLAPTVSSRNGQPLEVAVIGRKLAS